MIDHEKVIRALVACVDNDTEEDMDCDNCPYQMYNSQMDCIWKVMYGSLEIIREQKSIIEQQQALAQEGRS